MKITKFDGAFKSTVSSSFYPICRKKVNINFEEAQDVANIPLHEYTSQQVSKNCRKQYNLV